MEKEKYKIKHSNTDIRKLWNLARNGVFAYATVNSIMETSDEYSNEYESYIVFNSKRSFDKFKKFEFSASAMYNKQGF